MQLLTPSLFTTAATLLATTISPTLARAKPKDAILLSTVKSLTLRADKPTSHRRVPAIPQLTCIGGNAKGLYEVDVLRCRNAGAEYGAEDIAWTCQAALPPEFKLGSTDVVCEGYDSAEDPYVLKGSCAVEYRLMLTEVGEEKFGSRSGWGGERGKGIPWANVLFWVAFIGILVFALVISPGGRRGNARGGRRGWGGGGGGDDPPPPYTPFAPKPRYSSARGASPWGWGGDAAGSGQGWRPGFWSGAATGAAAGYAAGARGNRDRHRDNYAQPGPSSWFGGGGGGGAAPRSYGSGSGSSSSSASASRYESTGFGSTRRR